VIHLIDITGLPPDSTTPVTLRFCAGLPGHKSTPLESPANAVWLPGVTEPLHFSRELFGGRDAGASRVGAGVIELANDDGSRDYLRSWAFQGQPVTVRSGLPGQALADFVTTFAGVVKELVRTRQTISFSCRDWQEDLSRPLPVPKYLGTNSGPTGIEGTEDDLKGKYLPTCWGYCPNVEGHQVNTSLRIYRVHFRAVHSIVAMSEGRQDLISDGDVATSALLASATVASGHYLTCLAEGLFRVNSGKEIRADVEGDNVGGYVNDTAGIMRRILEVHGWTTSDFSAADLTALAAKNSAEVGLYDNGGADVLKLLDRLAAGIWAWFCPDRLGVLRFGRIEAPAAPLSTLTDVKNFELEETTSGDLTGTPASLVRCRYAPNWSVMRDSQIASVVTEARRAWLAQQYREVTSTTDGEADPDILARWPLAEELVIDSLFRYEADALAEAQRRHAFRAAGYSLFTFSRAWEFAASIEPGRTYTLQSGRFLLNAGAPVVVIGDETILSANTARFTCYG